MGPFFVLLDVGKMYRCVFLWPPTHPPLVLPDVFEHHDQKPYEFIGLLTGNLTSAYRMSTSIHALSVYTADAFRK